MEVQSPLKKFNGSVDRFKTKYEAIHETQDIASTNYQSIKELEEASKKLVELEKALDNQHNLDEDFSAAKDTAEEHLRVQEERLLKLEVLNNKLEKGQNLTPEELDFKNRQEALKRRDDDYQEFKKKYGLDKEIQKTEQAVSAASFDIDRLSDTLSGKVSIDDMSNAASQIDNGYDQTLSDLSVVVTGDKSTEYIEAWARTQFGDKMYEAASALKNGASTAISGVSDFISLDDIFGGSWRSPAVAAKKIETGLKTIQSAATKVSTVANNVFSSVTGNDSVLLGKLGNFNSMGIGTLGAFAGVSSVGIGSINSFSQGNIGAGIGGIKDGFTSARKAYSDVIGKDIANKKAELENEKLKLADENTLSGSAEKEKKIDKTNQGNPNEAQNNESNKGYSTFSSEGGGSNTADDDFSADMIHEINVVIEGVSSSKNSQCTINGVPYRLSGYSLSQDLIQPMILNLSIEKEEKIETQSDVVFADATQLIGKSFEMNVSTIKSSQEDNNATPKPAFVFKGMIIDVAASRSTACSQSANITIASWDSLLQNAPHCRSFENMTLKDIISFVLKPYKEIKSKIQPRFNEKIPYIVQYNQSDYAFISMLAIRFGEWMYNNGQEFIFGELDECPSSAISLEYPGGSLMSYSLHQGLNDFAFNHLLVDHYQFGKNNGVVKVSAQGISDGNVNDWTDKAFQASQQRYANSKISALSVGGFDSGQDDEGADAILNYSLKIEAQGKKTALMTVQGYSKLALLQIGQTFLIRDNIQNKSGENQDVEQKALKIISINHSFDYNQEYSNNFTAVPVACNYPAYSDADIHAVSPSQRAKVIDNKDTQKLGRIKVQFPWQEVQDKQMITPWLRIAVPYAGKNKGELFIPEIGEEVMVGFEMNNAERPYIIGALYNGGEGKSDEKWASSEEQNGTSNNIKAIRTRNGHTILFNDKGNAGLLEIYDNNNNTYHITLSADDKKITIYSAGEIEVVADGDINVTSKGNIGVNADGNVGIKSKGSISMEAKKEVSIQASKVKVR